MQITQFLNTLRHVKVEGTNKWSADCPCPHDTPQKHLSITTKNNKILIKCFGAHSNEEIVTALNLQLSDLFLDTKQFQIVATYDYKDETGILLYQKVRYEPKSFRQRHMVNGEWVWNLNGCRRVLYALRDVLKAHKVYLVEGEKDADNLMFCNVTATTAGGTNDWRPEFAESLRGKEVVIIPDRDPPGMQLAQKEAQDLKDIANVKVVLLPTKDISEWLPNHTIGELKTLEQSPEVLYKISPTVQVEQTEHIEEIEPIEPIERVEQTDENEPIEKIGSRTEQIDKTVWKQVGQWLDIHIGEQFTLDLVCKHLDLNTRDTRQSVAKKLHYEVERGRLEKFSHFSAPIYKYINTNINILKWREIGSRDPLDLQWPTGVDGSQFGFDGRVEIPEKGLVVLAGSTNTGKSVFCRNFLWKNMDKYPCSYFTSETSDADFADYASRMTWADPVDLAGHEKFELIWRTTDYKDVIRPDGINIIDWLNLGDNFYQIGTVLEGIKNKLNKGIALIALQKDPNKDLGMGGMWSEHLSSLYLTLDYNRLTVKKAKKWHEWNPNGKSFGFDIVDRGTHFTNLRLLQKCGACWNGKTKGGIQCPICEGKGWVDAEKYE